MTGLEYSFDAGSHYERRKARAALHVRGCRKKGDPTCGGGFKCRRCGKLVGWCRGGHDGTVRDGWCDVCWGKPPCPSTFTGDRCELAPGHGGWHEHTLPDGGLCRWKDKSPPKRSNGR